MSTASPRAPALGFIFVTLVLLVLGFGIIIPVLPGLVTEFEGGSVSAGSHAYGWLIMVFALMQFIGSPILGALSDRFGRRKVILIALAGSTVDNLVMGLAPTLGWLFVGRVVAGLTAGVIATANAYIADVTPPERRAQGFGLVGAAFGLGFVIGPAVGGVLGHYHLRLPFFVSAGCLVLNWLYGAFVLPESLPPDKRRAFEWKRANPAGALLLLRRLPGLFGLAGMYFLYFLGSIMLQSTWVLYTGYRYGWSTRQVGLSLAAVGIAMAVVQARLVRPILGGLGEQRGLAGGLLLSAAVMAGYGLATRGWMIYVLILAGAFGGIAGPAAQALITRHVPADEQGAVQGVLAGLGSLAGVFGPPLAAWSFALCVAPHTPLPLPGVAFFEAAGLFLLALALALRAFRGDARAARAA
ncbi:MAG TPA: TCR/Tet family MFS transporter [Opitutaceae bacterium]|nr:TCR/Tet family MFS transporter [Opitutaceae bacterium]